MKRLLLAVALATLFGMVVPATEAAEHAVALDEVPEAVVRAAMEAVPGIELVSAEIEEEDGETLYELEGRLDGERYEIELTAQGEVVEIETGDDDGDDPDDGHDDGEDDD